LEREQQSKCTTVEDGRESQESFTIIISDKYRGTLICEEAACW